MTNVRFFLSALLVTSFITGCGDTASGGSSTGDDGGGSDGEGGSDRGDEDEDGDGDEDGQGFTEGEPSIACERYVECVAATSPAMLDQVSNQFGDEGACWDDEELAGACTAGCAEALDAAQREFPEEERCAACEVSSDCGDPDRRHCAGGACVECIDDADCEPSAGGPRCHEYRCVPDPTPECVAQALALMTGGDAGFVECVQSLCADEAMDLFRSGACVGVDPCGGNLGCMEQVTEDDPFYLCMDETYEVCDRHVDE